MRLCRELQKVTAGALCVCFLVTQEMIAPASLARAESVPANVTAFPELDPFKLHIPESLGKIEAAFAGQDSRTVVLIQDAHAIPDAQKNIQKLIGFFQEEYGIDDVAVEGAPGPLEPQIFKSFPDPQKLRSVFKTYLQKGELSGAAAAAIFNTAPSRYEGVESWSLYEEGYRAYLNAMAHRIEILKNLDQREKELAENKKNTYSPALLRVDQALQNFLKDKADLASVLQILSEVLLPEPQSELALVLEQSQAQGEDSSRAAEVRRIAEKIRVSWGTAHGSKGEMRFNQKYQAFQTGQLTAQAFALFLLPYSNDEAQHAALVRLAGSQKRLEAIEGTQFFRDFTEYSQRVKALLLTTDEVRMLDQEVEQLNLLRRLAEIKLDQEDWEKVKQWEAVRLKDGGSVLRRRSGKSEDEVLPRRQLMTGVQGLSPLSSETVPGSNAETAQAQPDGLRLGTVPMFSSLETLLQPALEFYRNAKARDGAMFENVQRLLGRKGQSLKEAGTVPESSRLTTDDSLLSIHDSQSTLNDSIILVAGGFHTRGITQLLKQKDISYVVVMPVIASIPEKTSYAEQMTGQVSWSHYLKVEHGAIDLQAAFIRGTRDRLLGASRESSVLSREEKQNPSSAQGLSPLPQGTVPSDPWLLKTWRDQIIRDLADQGKIEQAGQYTRFIDEVVKPANEDPFKRQWIKNIKNFMIGMRQLDASGQLDPAHVMRLLGTAAAFSPAVPLARGELRGFTLTGGVLRPAARQTGLDEAGVPRRSEVRSFSGDQDKKDIRDRAELYLQQHAGLVGEMTAAGFTEEQLLSMLSASTSYVANFGFSEGDGPEQLWMIGRLMQDRIRARIQRGDSDHVIRILTEGLGNQAQEVFQLMDAGSHFAPNLLRVIRDTLVAEGQVPGDWSVRLVSLDLDQHALYQAALLFPRIEARAQTLGFSDVTLEKEEGNFWDREKLLRIKLEKLNDEPHLPLETLEQRATYVPGADLVLNRNASYLQIGVQSGSPAYFPLPRPDRKDQSDFYFRSALAVRNMVIFAEPGTILVVEPAEINYKEEGFLSKMNQRPNFYLRGTEMVIHGLEGIWTKSIVNRNLGLLVVTPALFLKPFSLKTLSQGVAASLNTPSIYKTPYPAKGTMSWEVHKSISVKRRRSEVRTVTKATEEQDQQSAQALLELWKKKGGAREKAGKGHLIAMVVGNVVEGFPPQYESQFPKGIVRDSKIYIRMFLYALQQASPAERSEALDLLAHGFTYLGPKSMGLGQYDANPEVLDTAAFLMRLLEEPHTTADEETLKTKASALLGNLTHNFPVILPAVFRGLPDFSKSWPEAGRSIRATLWQSTGGIFPSDVDRSFVLMVREWARNIQPFAESEIVANLTAGSGLTDSPQDYQDLGLRAVFYIAGAARDENQLAIGRNPETADRERVMLLLWREFLEGFHKKSGQREAAQHFAEYAKLAEMLLQPDAPPRILGKITTQAFGPEGIERQKAIRWLYWFVKFGNPLALQAITHTVGGVKAAEAEWVRQNRELASVYRLPPLQLKGDENNPLIFVKNGGRIELFLPSSTQSKVQVGLPDKPLFEITYEQNQNPPVGTSVPTLRTDSKLGVLNPPAGTDVPALRTDPKLDVLNPPEDGHSGIHVQAVDPSMIKIPDKNFRTGKTYYFGRYPDFSRILALGNITSRFHTSLQFEVVPDPNHTDRTLLKITLQDLLARNHTWIHAENLGLPVGNYPADGGPLQIQGVLQGNFSFLEGDWMDPGILADRSLSQMISLAVAHAEEELREKQLLAYEQTISAMREKFTVLSAQAKALLAEGSPVPLEEGARERLSYCYIYGDILIQEKMKKGGQYDYTQPSGDTKYVVDPANQLIQLLEREILAVKAGVTADVWNLVEKRAQPISPEATHSFGEWITQLNEKLRVLFPSVSKEKYRIRFHQTKQSWDIGIEVPEHSHAILYDLRDVRAKKFLGLLLQLNQALDAQGWLNFGAWTSPKKANVRAIFAQLLVKKTVLSGEFQTLESFVAALPVRSEVRSMGSAVSPLSHWKSAADRLWVDLRYLFDVPSISEDPQKVIKGPALVAVVYDAVGQELSLTVKSGGKVYQTLAPFKPGSANDSHFMNALRRILFLRHFNQYPEQIGKPLRHVLNFSLRAFMFLGADLMAVLAASQGAFILSLGALLMAGFFGIKIALLFEEPYLKTAFKALAVGLVFGFIGRPFGLNYQTGALRILSGLIERHNRNIPVGDARLADLPTRRERLQNRINDLRAGELVSVIGETGKTVQIIPSENFLKKIAGTFDPAGPNAELGVQLREKNKIVEFPENSFLLEALIRELETLHEKMGTVQFDLIPALIAGAMVSVGGLLLSAGSVFIADISVLSGLMTVGFWAYHRFMGAREAAKSMAFVLQQAFIAAETGQRATSLFNADIRRSEVRSATSSTSSMALSSPDSELLSAALIRNIYVDPRDIDSIDAVSLELDSPQGENVLSKLVGTLFVTEPAVREAAVSKLREIRDSRQEGLEKIREMAALRDDEFQSSWHRFYVENSVAVKGDQLNPDEFESLRIEGDSIPLFAIHLTDYPPDVDEQGAFMKGENNYEPMRGTLHFTVNSAVGGESLKVWQYRKHALVIPLADLIRANPGRVIGGVDGDFMLTGPLRLPASYRRFDLVQDPDGRVEKTARQQALDYVRAKIAEKTGRKGVFALKSYHLWDQSLPAVNALRDLILKNGLHYGHHGSHWTLKYEQVMVYFYVLYRLLQSRRERIILWKKNGGNPLDLEDVSQDFEWWRRNAEARGIVLPDFVDKFLRPILRIFAENTDIPSQALMERWFDKLAWEVHPNEKALFEQSKQSARETLVRWREQIKSRPVRVTERDLDQPHRLAEALGWPPLHRLEQLFQEDKQSYHSRLAIQDQETLNQDIRRLVRSIPASPNPNMVLPYDIWKNLYQTHITSSLIRDQILRIPGEREKFLALDSAGRSELIEEKYAARSGSPKGFTSGILPNMVTLIENIFLDASGRPRSDEDFNLALEYVGKNEGFIQDGLEGIPVFRQMPWMPEEILDTAPEIEKTGEDIDPDQMEKILARFGHAELAERRRALDDFLALGSANLQVFFASAPGRQVFLNSIQGDTPDYRLADALRILFYHAGVFASLLPELERIRGVQQPDFYHGLTVDEYVFNVIETAERRIDAGDLRKEDSFIYLLVGLLENIGRYRGVHGEEGRVRALLPNILARFEMSGRIRIMLEKILVNREALQRIMMNDSRRGWVEEDERKAALEDLAERLSVEDLDQSLHIAEILYQSIITDAIATPDYREDRVQNGYTEAMKTNLASAYQDLIKTMRELKRRSEVRLPSNASRSETMTVSPDGVSIVEQVSSLPDERGIRTVEWGMNVTEKDDVLRAVKNEIVPRIAAIFIKRVRDESLQLNKKAKISEYAWNSAALYLIQTVIDRLFEEYPRPSFSVKIESPETLGEIRDRVKEELLNQKMLFESFTPFDERSEVIIDPLDNKTSDAPVLAEGVVSEVIETLFSDHGGQALSEAARSEVRNVSPADSNRVNPVTSIPGVSKDAGQQQQERQPVSGAQSATDGRPFDEVLKDAIEAGSEKDTSPVPLSDQPVPPEGTGRSEVRVSSQDQDAIRAREQKVREVYKRLRKRRESLNKKILEIEKGLKREDIPQLRAAEDELYFVNDAIDRLRSRLRDIRVATFGDVHADFKAIDEHLTAAKLKAGDYFTQVGDVPNRGENPEEADNRLREEQETRRQLGGDGIRLAGNHELMLLESGADASGSPSAMELRNKALLGMLRNMSKKDRKALLLKIEANEKVKHGNKSGSRKYARVMDVLDKAFDLVKDDPKASFSNAVIKAKKKWAKESGKKFNEQDWTSFLESEREVFRNDPDYVYSKVYRRLVSDVRRGNIQAASFLQGYLNTHAGVGDAMRKQLKVEIAAKLGISEKDVTPAHAASYMNFIFREAVITKNFTHAIFDRTEGIFWKRDVEEDANAAEWPQVYGHNPDFKNSIRVFAEGDLVNVDAMISQKGYGYLDVSRHGVVARRWENFISELIKPRDSKHIFEAFASDEELEDFLKGWLDQFKQVTAPGGPKIVFQSTSAAADKRSEVRTTRLIESTEPRLQPRLHKQLQYINAGTPVEVRYTVNFSRLTRSGDTVFDSFNTGRALTIFPGPGKPFPYKLLPLVQDNAIVAIRPLTSDWLPSDIYAQKSEAPSASEVVGLTDDQVKQTFESLPANAQVQISYGYLGENFSSNLTHVFGIFQSFKQRDALTYEVTLEALSGRGVLADTALDFDVAPQIKGLNVKRLVSVRVMTEDEMAALPPNQISVQPLGQTLVWIGQREDDVENLGHAIALVAGGPTDARIILLEPEGTDFENLSGRVIRYSVYSRNSRDPDALRKLLEDAENYSPSEDGAIEIQLDEQGYPDRLLGFEGEGLYGGMLTWLQQQIQKRMRLDLTNPEVGNPRRSEVRRMNSPDQQLQNNFQAAVPSSTFDKPLGAVANQELNTLALALSSVGNDRDLLSANAKSWIRQFRDRGARAMEEALLVRVDVLLYEAAHGAEARLETGLSQLQPDARYSVALLLPEKLLKLDNADSGTLNEIFSGYVEALKGRVLEVFERGLKNEQKQMFAHAEIQVRSGQDTIAQSSQTTIPQVLLGDFAQYTNVDGRYLPVIFDLAENLDVLKGLQNDPARLRLIGKTLALAQLYMAELSEGGKLSPQELKEQVLKMLGLEHVPVDQFFITRAGAQAGIFEINVNSVIENLSAQARIRSEIRTAA